MSERRGGPHWAESMIGKGVEIEADIWEENTKEGSGHKKRIKSLTGGHVVRVNKVEGIILKAGKKELQVPPLEALSLLTFEQETTSRTVIRKPDSDTAYTLGSLTIRFRKWKDE